MPIIHEYGPTSSTVVALAAMGSWIYDWLTLKAMISTRACWNRGEARETEFTVYNGPQLSQASPATFREVFRKSTAHVLQVIYRPSPVVDNVALQRINACRGKA